MFGSGLTIKINKMKNIYNLLQYYYKLKSDYLLLRQRVVLRQMNTDTDNRLDIIAAEKESFNWVILPALTEIGDELDDELEALDTETSGSQEVIVEMLPVNSVNIVYLAQHISQENVTVVKLTSGDTLEVALTKEEILEML